MFKDSGVAINLNFLQCYTPLLLIHKLKDFSRNQYQIPVPYIQPPYNINNWDILLRMLLPFILSSVFGVLCFFVGQGSAQAVIWSFLAPTLVYIHLKHLCSSLTSPQMENTYITPSNPVIPMLRPPQSFWMGMQPGNNDAVIQKMVSNRGMTKGEWGF